MPLSDPNLRLLSAHIAATGSAEGFIPTPRKKRNNRESQLQQQCVKWWKMAARGLGVDARLLYAVPNGAMYGTGIARVIRAKILLAEGLRPGWPDVAIDAPRFGYHGLRIEMKLPDTKPSPEQDEIHSLLREEGYRVEVCRTLDEFIKTVLTYFNK